MSGYDGDYYEFACLDSTGAPRGRSFKLPRVTSILDVLNKPLTWWAYKLGVEATLEFARTQDKAVIDAAKVDEVYEELKKLGRKGEAVTPSSSSKKAAGRGGDIHDIAEAFFAVGRIPTPAEVPPEYHGYVKALAAWWKPLSSYKIVATEVLLYSLKHGYAGTTDLILEGLDGSYIVVDFKTSKGIYESALLQVAAYEYAAKERSYVPWNAPVGSIVVRLGQDGQVEVKQTPCTIDDFLAVKKAWETVEELKGVLADARTRNGSKPSHKRGASGGTATTTTVVGGGSA